MRGHLTIFYPRGAWAELGSQRVEVIVIRAPLTERDNVRSADANAAEATVRLADGSTITVPFDEITIPQYVSRTSHVLLVRVDVTGLGDPKLADLNRTIGKRPEQQWGTGWMGQPLNWRSIYVAKDEAEAERWAAAVRQRVPDATAEVLLTSAPVPTVLHW